MASMTRPYCPCPADLLLSAKPPLVLIGPLEIMARTPEVRNMYGDSEYIRYQHLQRQRGPSFPHLDRLIMRYQCAPRYLHGAVRRLGENNWRASLQSELGCEIIHPSRRTSHRPMELLTSPYVPKTWRVGGRYEFSRRLT